MLQKLSLKSKRKTINFTEKISIQWTNQNIKYAKYSALNSQKTLKKKKANENEKC
jgi:hypothetical protein